MISLVSTILSGLMLIVGLVFSDDLVDREGELHAVCRSSEREPHDVLSEASP